MIRNLSHLEAFYWIARLGGFHTAAERLGITQPTISVRLRELERGAGTLLIDRSVRRARMTAQGSAIFELVERILALNHDLEARLRQGQALRGTFRLGVSDGFALVCLADFMKAARRAHPELAVAVTVGNSRSLEQRMLAGELDLTILSHAHDTPDLQIQPLGLQEIGWVAAPALGLPEISDPHDLLAHQIFTDPPPSHLFSVLTDWFASCGIPTPRLSNCDSVAVIATLVAAGAGISVLPLCIVEREIEAGAVRRIQTVPPLPAQAIVAATRSFSQHPALPGMYALVRDVTGQTGFLTREDGN
jgi:DNA-binding transcriptional LysR family regulator